ncbi:hypothetical protein, partial [Micromonospora sp. NPDC005174]|uniref:hypothetical protein n=1 Tax=Micromonospora sp. NPDC005174 TaxID=3157018 RepID=UPI0033BBFE0A
VDPYRVRDHHDPTGQSGRVTETVTYRCSRPDVDLDEVDLASVAVIDISYGKVVIDAEKGKLYYRLPNGYPEIRVIGDFFDRLERIASPPRLSYLLAKPNPYRIKLIDLTRSQLRARRNDKAIPWPAVAAGAAVVTAVAAVVKIFS